MTTTRCIDCSNELILSRFQQGVCLLRPEQLEHRHTIDNKNSLGHLKKMPFNIYVIDTESRMQTINEATAITLELFSINDSIGKTVYDIASRESARSLIAIDKRVMQNQRTEITDDPVMLNNGARRKFLSIKAPLYNTRHETVGIFGCSVLLNEQQPLASAIAQIAELGLLQPQPAAFPQYRNNKLTQRESEVLLLLGRYFSAKIIAAKLGISHRTVEKHIEMIKEKLGLHSKNDILAYTVQSPP